MSSKSFEKKNKLRTSEDVFNRLNWDASFNKEDFLIGYVDRFRGMMELPFLDFTPGGDIPFHRIYYFRNQEGFVWDRETRLDLIFHSGEHDTAYSEESVALREDQMQKALKATAEAEEEKREMADQRARRQRQRARQAARRGMNDFYSDASALSSHSSSVADLSDPLGLEAFQPQQAESSSPPKPAAAAKPAGVSAIPAYHFSRFTSQWIPLSNPTSHLGQRQFPEDGTLKVVSFNVLFDFYFPEQLFTAERNEAIFRILQEADADIIALQEVTPAFLGAILSQEWVQETYCSSSQPGSPLVEPYGQLILSRLPLVELNLLTFSSSSKTILIAQLAVRGRSLIFATLHLTSNHAQANTGPQKRQWQLRELERTLRHFEAATAGAQVILAGDFNASDDEPADVLTGFRDVWPLLSQSEGITFDPTVNPLAKLNSITGLPHRLDRIYFKGSSLGNPSQISLLGTEPIPHPEAAEKPFYPSDHFGLLALFSLQSPPGSDVSGESDFWSDEDLERTEGSSSTQPSSSGRPTPTYMTALVIVPPRDVWHEFLKLRSKNCGGQAMPHVSLLYGFWPEEHFPEAVELIQQELVNWKPFEVTLRDFGYFGHRHTYTAWAKPESDQIVPLQASLQAIFPECDEVSRRSHVEKGFTPHITLGNRLISHEQCEVEIQRWREIWTSLTFTLGEVCLIARQRGKPFEIRHCIPFGKPANLGLDAVLCSHQVFETKEKAARREQAIDFCEELCLSGVRTCTGSRDGSLHLIGSAKLESQTSESDVDLVFVTPVGISKSQFFATLKTQLKVHPQVTSSRIVSDALVPLAQLEVFGVEVDIQFAALPTAHLHTPTKAPASVLVSLEQSSLRAFAGLTDTEVLANCVPELSRYKFQEVLRAVRAWAKLRDLSSNGFCFLGGIAWSVLVASLFTRVNHEQLTSEQILEAFFETYATQGWKEPVFLRAPTGPVDLGHGNSPLRIMTPSAPHQNSTRNVTISTLRVLVAELARAAALIKEAREKGERPWHEIYRPLVPAEEVCHSFLVLEVSASTPGEIDQCSGWLNGHLVVLVLALEAKMLSVRPCSKAVPGPDGISKRYHLVLNKEPRPEGSATISFAEDVQAFRASFASWPERPSTAALKITQLKTLK